MDTNVSNEELEATLPISPWLGLSAAQTQHSQSQAQDVLPH